MPATFSKYYLFVLSITTLLIYSAVLDNRYIWDDFEYIEILKLHEKDQLLFNAFSESFYISDNYYRPIAIFSILFEAKFSNANPFWGHLTNLLFHIFNSVLIYLISNSIYARSNIIPKEKSKTVALFSSLFFAMNPNLIESVSWISGRFDLMVTLFSLLIIYIVICKQDNKFSFLLVSTCYLIGALTKEMIVALPLSIFTLLIFCKRPSNSINNTYILMKHKFVYLYPIIIGGLAYLIIRYFALGYLVIAEENQYKMPFTDSLEHVHIVIKTIGIYIIKLVLPFNNISPIHQFPENNDWWDLYTVVGLLSIGVTIIGLFFKISIQISLIILIYFTALLPVLNIIPAGIGLNIVQERFLTLPLALVSCVIGIPIYSFIQNLSSSLHKYLYGVIAFWLLLSAMTIHSIVPMWKNNDIFWIWNIKSHPNSYIANNNYAALLFSNGQYTNSLKVFKTSYELNRTEAALKMIARIYLLTKEFSKAEISYNELLKNHPTTTSRA
ncbi:MAG: tetratricopeptide repeat protein, partial [Saprospiraceae bacterium]